MSWAPDYYDRTQNWEWPYSGGLWNLGPVTIPPRLPFTGLVDRVTGKTWFVGQNGTRVVLSLVQPVAVNVKIYQPFDGPFLPYGTRLGVSNGFLVLDTPNPPLAGSSAPVWIYNVSNPQGQTFPEPTNIPTLLPVPVPGVPSSSPAPTGGGFGAFNAQMPRGSTPPFLTVILTTGMVKNLAWWNGTAWVDPGGALIENTATTTTLDPNNKDANFTLSNGNLTVTSSLSPVNWRSAISTSPSILGRRYFRLQTTTNMRDSILLGLCLNTERTDNFIGFFTPSGWGGYALGNGSIGHIVHNDVDIATIPAMTAGDYFVAAYDAVNGALYFTTMTAAGVLNTNWNGTNANPATVTGGISVTLGLQLRPGVSLSSSFSDLATLDTKTVINDPTLTGFRTYDWPSVKIIGGPP